MLYIFVYLVDVLVSSAFIHLFIYPLFACPLPLHILLTYMQCFIHTLLFVIFRFSWLFTWYSCNFKAVLAIVDFSVLLCLFCCPSPSSLQMLYLHDCACHCGQACLSFVLAPFSFIAAAVFMVLISSSLDITFKNSDSACRLFGYRRQTGGCFQSTII